MTTAGGSGSVPPAYHPTEPVPRLPPRAPAPAAPSLSGVVDPSGPGQPAQARRIGRRGHRPRDASGLAIPARITVTRVAAARTRHLTGTAVRRINDASRADGAAQSGLSGLIWTHALSSAGDALIAVSLAGTLFFAAASGEQRGNVALYLLITVAPFAVVAPVIGPALDRMQRGRRSAIALTLVGRAILAWVMAVNFDSIGLYPAAFGALVLSKAYAVLRGAVVPRVLPGEMTLVTANSRLSIFGLATAGVIGGLGAGVANLAGFGWELAATAAVFVLAAGSAIRLPGHVDHAEGELEATVLGPGAAGALTRRGRRSLGPSVTTALRATATLRGLVGFLVIFTPFLAQGTIGGVKGTVVLGGVAAAAGGGSAVGTMIGSKARLRSPDRLVLWLTGIAAITCVVAAAAYSIATLVVLALVAGITSSLAKHALDAIIQGDVPASLRSSAFARSETVLQLTWVFGGAVAIALPLTGWLAFSVAAALVVAGGALTYVGVRRGPRGPRRHRGPLA